MADSGPPSEAPRAGRRKGRQPYEAPNALQPPLAAEDSVTQTIRFDGELRSARGGGCIVELPPAVIAALGGARVRVRGTLAGVAFASNTLPMGGGRAALGIHKATRVAAAVTFGDRVSIELARDENPRELVVPDELSRALAADDLALAVFERLSFSHRREYASYVAEAKRPEQLARRVEETVRQLRARA